jgi:ActR/RegA family two-component response regulator
MLLTGYAEVNAAIAAVNKGNIFRYLTKPCSKEVLIDAINLGLAQYHATVTGNALAQRAEMATNRSWDPVESVPFDNVGNAAALPGPGHVPISTSS